MRAAARLRASWASAGGARSRAAERIAERLAAEPLQARKAVNH